jgi:hypothetical protein
MQWLHDAHESIAGESFVAGILKNGRKFPSGRESYFFRFPLDLADQLDFTRWENIKKVFCFYLPHSAELCLLTDARLGLGLLRKHSSLPSPITGLTLREVKKSAVVNRPSGRTYDPIGAQINEVLNSMETIVREQIINTRHLWTEIFKGELPHELANADRRLKDSTAPIVKLLKSDLEKTDKQLILSCINQVAWTLQDISSTCANLCGYLRDYQLPGREVNIETTYAQTATSPILQASRSYCEEIALRLGIEKEVSILPVLSDNFFVQMRLFQTHGNSIHRGEKSLVLVAIPRSFRFRLGAFPVLAHEVAHIRVQAMKQEIEKLTLRTWPGRFNEAFGSLKLNESPLTLEATKEYARRGRVGNSWATEILVDLIATATVGPAYIFSFARFIVGTPLDGNADWERNPTHPPIAQRLFLCLDFLKFLDFDVQFESRYLKWINTPIDEELARIALSAVKKPYTVDEHRQIRHVQQQLQAGQIANHNPVIILNALWEAVAQKRGHINEIATLLSMNFPK